MPHTEYEMSGVADSGRSVTRARLGPGDFDDERVRCHVHDARAKHVNQLHDAAARRLRRPDLDERQIAVNRAVGRDELDALDFEQLVEVGLDPGTRAVGRIDDDGHARDVGPLGAADGKRLDVVRAAAKE
jgi:hypothetical protein